MDTVGRFLRVSSVVGRSNELYRGVSIEPATPRDPSAAVPLATLLATLRALEGLTAEYARKQITLTRGDHEPLRIHVDVDPVSLPDLNFEGPPDLALRALHAWVPLFGPTSLRDGDYAEVVDATRDVESLVTRYLARERAAVAKFGALVGNVDPDEHTNAPPTNRGRLAIKIAVVGVIAVALPLTGLWIFRAVTRRAQAGAACTKSAQCESRECLSADPFEPSSHDDGSPLMRASTIKNGVCTQMCSADSDCPASMSCIPALMQGGASLKDQYNVQRCAPTAWGR